MRTPGGRRARAFAPGHVTGAFAPRAEARDPRGRGSVGLGLVLDLGVFADVEWSPSARPSVRVRSDLAGPVEISSEVAVRLAARRPGRLRVRLVHQLPVGQGFGMSAAGAAATALAVGRAVGEDRRRCLETAHLADLFGGGGLGGVAAILGGGLERRLRPGLPPFGRIERRPVSAPLLVGVVGAPVPSPRILFDPRWLDRISAAYRTVSPERGPMTLERFWEASERFTDRLGLAPRAVRDVVRAVRRRGGRAAQAMFGQSFFAELPTGEPRARLVRWMEDRGIRGVELNVGRSGARIVPVPPGVQGGRPGDRPPARGIATLFKRTSSRRLP